MPEMLFRTAFDSAPGGKRRVYFTCHPDDFGRYFERICQEVLELQDVVIYYTKNMTETFAEKELETDLGSNNLFIVPVTYRLLSKPNRAMDQDLAYAKEKHIPILPFMMEPGLDEIYARPDKFGELQYLQPDAEDKTAISFREKLRKYLEAVLVSDETVKRIQAAFDAYIFLSYRKKDRSYANELMRLIHKDPRYRDVAIWYDEFLTPGESFRKNIDKMLQKSDLFALLVTPSLLEEPDGKPNFVMAEEFPAARDAGKTILPAQMEQTDEEQLSKKFAGIPPCADPRQEKAFRDRLAETLDRLAKEESADNPEHNFLIGLAYLEGIDVEMNKERGLALVTAAAEADQPEAMGRLYDMYAEGAGVQLNYRAALKWAQKLADYCICQYGEKNETAVMALSRLCEALERVGNYEKALETAERVYDLRCRILGSQARETLIAMSVLGELYRQLGYHKEALELNKGAYTELCSSLGQEHPDTLIAMHNLANSYRNLGDYDKAFEMNETAYYLQCQVLGKEHPETLSALRDLARVYHCLGEYYIALDLTEQSYNLMWEICGEAHPNTLAALGDLARAYYYVDDPYKSSELYGQVYQLRWKMLGIEHPATLSAMSDLGISYIRLGDSEKAWVLQKDTYERWCQVTGKSYPSVLLAYKNMAYLYDRLEDNHSKIQWTEKSYTQHCLLLGPKHPDTIAVLMELAEGYDCLFDHPKALELRQKAYDLYAQILGPEHPETLAALKAVAESYWSVEKYQKSMEIQEEAYTLLCAVQGREHPDTIAYLRQIAFSYSDMQAYERALALQNTVYDLRCKILGTTHPDTLRSLKELAGAYSDMAAFLKEQLVDEIYPEEESGQEIEVAFSLEEFLEKVDRQKMESTPRTCAPDKDTTEPITDMRKRVDYYSEKTLALSQQAYELCSRVLGEKHKDTVSSLGMLASAEYGCGEWEKGFRHDQLYQQLYREMSGRQW